MAFPPENRKIYEKFQKFLLCFRTLCSMMYLMRGDALIEK